MCHIIEGQAVEGKNRFPHLYGFHEASGMLTGTKMFDVEVGDKGRISLKPPHIIDVDEYFVEAISSDFCRNKIGLPWKIEVKTCLQGVDCVIPISKPSDPSSGSDTGFDRAVVNLSLTGVGAHISPLAVWVPYQRPNKLRVYLGQTPPDPRLMSTNWACRIVLPVMFHKDDVTFYDGFDVSVRRFYIPSEESASEVLEEVTRSVRQRGYEWDERFVDLVGDLVEITRQINESLARTKKGT